MILSYLVGAINIPAFLHSVLAVFGLTGIGINTLCPRVSSREQSFESTPVHGCVQRGPLQGASWHAQGWIIQGHNYKHAPKVFINHRGFHPPKHICNFKQVSVIIITTVRARGDTVCFPGQRRILALTVPNWWQQLC